MFTVYSKNECPFCVQSKMLLDRVGVNYEVVDIESSKDVYEEFKAHYRTVPQVFNGSEYIGGFEALQDYLVEREFV